MMKFVVKGASQSIRAQGNMYKTIQEYHGHYSKSEGIRIDYDGANLRAKTYFRVYENDCQFGNALNNWEIHKQLVHLQGVEFESFTPIEVDNPGDLKRVMLQDYNPSSTESPIYSLSQLHIYIDSPSQKQKLSIPPHRLLNTSVSTSRLSDTTRTSVT